MIGSNDKIAEWAGLECRCEFDAYTVHEDNNEIGIGNRYWGNCPRHSNGGYPPDYSRDEVAVGLLLVLAQKDYYPDLYYCQRDNGDHKWCSNLITDSELFFGETIAAAICAAVERLMESGK